MTNNRKEAPFYTTITTPAGFLLVREGEITVNRPSPGSE
jgi:hypothetical protein